MEAYDGRLLRLEYALDKAILSGDEWLGVCDELTSFFGAVGATISGRKVDSRNNLVWSDGVNDCLESYLREEWFRRDVRHATFPIMRQRGFATDYDVITIDSMRKDPFYADFLRRQRIEFFLGIHIESGNQDWIAGIHFKAGSAPLSDEVMAQIPNVKRALESAVRSATAIGSARLADWKSYFEGADRGLILLSPLGHIVEINDFAERVLSTASLSQTRTVSIPDFAADRRLQHLLRWVVSRDAITPPPPPVQFKTAKGMNLSIDAFRLPTGLAHFYSDVSALIVIKKVEDFSVDLSDVLKKRFQLTTAEVRIALALYSGHSLREVAATYQVADGTARQQIKSVFRKTGVHTQARLLKLISEMS